MVNANIASTDGTIRAVGPVDGHFTSPSGRKRSFHLSGVLFYLAPSYLRFDLKSLGERQALFGTNDLDYWFYSKEDDRFICGPGRGDDNLLDDLPIQPEEIADAMGLRGIAIDESNGNTLGAVQRIVDDFQQILFVARDQFDEAILEKEYWLDRYPPNQIRRVLFRDRNGDVVMESELDDYQSINERGTLLPTMISARWVKTGAFIRFRVRSWAVFEQVKADGVQFATPPECATNKPSRSRD